MSDRKDILPNLKLPQRQSPFQKITIQYFPLELHMELSRRAQRLSQRIPNYCRIILEHAVSPEYREDYQGFIDTTFDDNMSYHAPIHIPISNKKILSDLVEWDPFGVKKKNSIALSLLKKHLDVRSW